MKTSKSVDALNVQLDQKSTKPSKKVKNLLKDVDLTLSKPETALNKPLCGTITAPVEYNIIGMMQLRRTKRIPNASPQTLVLPNEEYEEIVVRGIRMKYTWDELARAIISDHLRTHKDSTHLFPTS